MTIPLPVIAVIAEVLAGRYTHDRLDVLFREAGATGEVPDGSKREKCATWLRRMRGEPSEIIETFLGRLLEDILEEELPAPEPMPRGELSLRAERQKERERIKMALAIANLTYLGSGRMIEDRGQPASRRLATLISTRNLPALEAEFVTLSNRATAHPRDALSVAANIVEGILGEMVDALGLQEPSNRTLNTLWAAVKSAINADPAAMPDNDLRKIVGAMAAMVDGLQGLRDDKSRAHAMRPKLARSYRIEPRHARLAVNASLALTVFLLEAWEAMEVRQRPG